MNVIVILRNLMSGATYVFGPMREEEVDNFVYNRPTNYTPVSCHILNDVTMVGDATEFEGGGYYFFS